MKNKIRIYRVGGAVRDMFLGMKSKDIDYSVEAPSYDAMRDYIIGRGGTIFVEKPEFVTIRAQVNGETCDYVLCRKEGAYSDGRRPDTVEVGTIYDDLARRDFTMNAIAIEEYSQDIIDPSGGIVDIRNRIIRCVGEPYDRIREDYLRLVRAARFSITKDMYISPNIEMMFSDISILSMILNTVSTDRIREEVTKMFRHNTIRSIEFFGAHPEFSQACFTNGIWLKATTES